MTTTLAVTVTPESLDVLLQAHPLLSDHGHPGKSRLNRTWEARQAAFLRDREILRASADRVQPAADWLATLEPTKRADTRSPGSYWLKHVMERATGTYVTNGAFIAAALLLDIPVHVFHDGPNPGVGVSWRSVNRLEAAR